MAWCLSNLSRVSGASRGKFNRHQHEIRDAYSLLLFNLFLCVIEMGFHLNKAAATRVELVFEGFLRLHISDKQHELNEGYRQPSYIFFPSILGE